MNGMWSNNILRFFFFFTFCKLCNLVFLLRILKIYMFLCFQLVHSIITYFPSRVMDVKYMNNVQ